VLRKNGEGRVSCLGAYVVVDLLERWTGDRDCRRSVAVETGRGGQGESDEVLKGRGYRFYHAVLQRVGEWNGDMVCPSSAAAVSSGAGSCRVQGSSSGGIKRRRH